MFKFLLFVILLIISIYLSEQFIRKKVGIKKRDESYKGVNSFHIWGKRVILISLFLSLVFISNSHWVPVLVVSLFGFDAVMEWKYKRSEKEYIIPLMQLSIIVVFVTVFELLNVVE